MGKLKSITVRGVEYPSQKAAAKALGVTEGAVTRARERGYLDGLGFKRRGDRSKPCRVGSRDYPSRAAAAKALGVSAGAVSTYLAVRDVIDKSETPDSGLFAKEPPSWARDSFNGGYGEQCGNCGAWCEVVRPGKTQCINHDCEVDG